MILDKEIIEREKRNIFSLAEKLARCKIDIFQFRFKDNLDVLNLKIAKNLASIMKKRKKMFIVNDRVDIAYLAGADGVHLGKQDLEVKDARKLLGKEKIVGKTVHNKDELVAFSKEEVDYLSVGPLFKTETKPWLVPWRLDVLEGLVKNVKKTLFGIGGIGLDNLSKVLAIGIRNVVVCREVILSNNFEETVEKLKLCLKKGF